MKVYVVQYRDIENGWAHAVYEHKEDAIAEMERLEEECRDTSLKGYEVVEFELLTKHGQPYIARGESIEE